MTETALAGRKVLVVEDEYFLAYDLARVFRSRGAEVIGPVASVDEALHLIEEAAHLDGAVLDVNLQGEMAYSVADALMSRGVPFVFATGYDKSSVPTQYAHITCCQKPVNANKLAQSLFA